MRFRAGPWLVSLAVFAVAATPLLRPYLVWGHSTGGDLARIEGFVRAISGGDLAPAWLPDFYLRHGSPLPSFYAPLVYYLAAALRVGLGLGVLWAPKIALALGWSLAVVGVHRLARTTVAAGGAAAAASALAAAPYLLVDVYVRNGLAEIWAFAALAFSLSAVWQAARDPSPRAIPVAALAVAALILCHNVTALLAAPLLVLFGLAAARGAGERRRAGGGLAAGIGLAAAFWLPALVEKDQVWAVESLTSGHFDYRGHFHSLRQLVVRGAGFAFSVAPDGRLPFAFGLLPWAGLAAGVLLLAIPSTRRRLGTGRRGTVALLLGGFASLAMVLPLSAPLWRLPLLAYVQFPWRFLLPASLLACTLLAAPVALLPTARARALATGLIGLLALWSARPYLDPRYAFASPEGGGPVLLSSRELPPAASLRPFSEQFAGEGLWARGVTGTAGHDYLPRGVEVLPERLPKAAAEAGRGARILASGWGYPEVWAEVEAAVPGPVHLAQFWYPGWRAWIDGAEVPVVAEGSRGRLEVEVPVGRHRVVARFGATRFRRLAQGASLLTAGALAAVWWRGRRLVGTEPASTKG